MDIVVIQQSQAHSIRRLLFEKGKSQVWLINKLEDNGIHMTATELSAALSCTRYGPKITKALEESIKILNEA